jgi:tetratricopeptide (TPR) repeat protein
MSRILLAAIALATVFASPASADPNDDCRESRRPNIRMNACTAVINGGMFDANAKALAYQYRGEARTDAGAFQDAISDFNQAIRLRPDNAQAFTGRGRARFSIGEFNGALSDFGEAIGIFPVEPEFYLNRGHVFLVQGNIEASITDLSEAIRLNPRIASAYNNRGLALRKKGDNAAALKDYDTAIALNPAFALAYSNRAALRETMGTRKTAIEDYQTALYLDPTIASARAALRRLGQEGAAVRESEKRIKDGKALAEQNCARCHAVGTAGDSANIKAPPFREIGNRHAMVSLAGPITRAIAAPHEEMPNFRMPDQQVDTIIAYINSLGTPPRR